MDNTGISSPDPLANSQDGSLCPITQDRKSVTPRKALRHTAGSAHPREITIITPKLQKARGHSPTKDCENEASPWRIRITVQAEQDNLSKSKAVSQCSPSKVFAERTFTTTVPLKSGDESSPRRRKSKGTPRKPRHCPSKGRSQSKTRRIAEVDLGAELTARGGNTAPSPTPKRGRGRPRKSVDPHRAESLNRKTRRMSRSPHAQSSHSQPKATPPEKVLNDQPVDLNDNNSNLVQPDDQYGEFDSVIESEGFSMVSVSSLPSAQSTSSSSTDYSYPEKNLSLSRSRQNITPLESGDSPIPPPPPKPAESTQCTREIDKPTTGTPKLFRVVRAGIALQGVLSPNQSSASKNASSKIQSSSPLGSTASPKERLDELFNGFGPGTQRELRAGLRLGEELAKRQSLDTRPNSEHQQAKEDVFAADLDIRYPQLPPADAADGYNLKVPRTIRDASPSFSNTQLPSPARSEVDPDDDRMSWKYDTLPQRAVASQLEPSGVADPIDGKCSATDRSMVEREAEWQRERDAISRQIRAANSSQVIVIDSDHEGDASCEENLEDEGDRWLEEAHSLPIDNSLSDVPPIFRQTDAPKPRRSQLPSPWMRKHQDVLESATNDSDLSWQPNQTGISGKTPETPADSHVISPLSSNLGSLESNDDSPTARKQTNVRIVTRPSYPKVFSDQESQPSTPAKEENQKMRSPSQTQTVTLCSGKHAHQKLADTVDENLESEEFLTDNDDFDSHLASHLSMQDDNAGRLEEDSGLDVNISTWSISGDFENVPQPQTPLPSTPLAKSRTPKHVRFSTEKPRHHPAAEVPALQSAPLPPAPTSWLGRVSSLLPSWGATALAAAVPLPSRPQTRIRLSQVDRGPLPVYMPWTQAHWWALIHIVRRAQADLAAFPYTSTMACANYLGRVVSVSQWAKKITKQDCAVVEAFIGVLSRRGAVRGMEDAVLKKAGKTQWGKAPGQMIDTAVVLSAVVAQWACDVQDGVCAVGWHDRAGIKTGTVADVWTKGDLPVDGPGVVYVL
ncbi:MAG: hypothetical protein L6R35_003664 [Caloplaca aegaea]|nr:MAG: hypothetical protein L6R35_003664 [Caloplaca aegaea]